MSAKDNLRLISYLTAAEIYDKGKNIFECFLPLIESTLMYDDRKHDITFLRLQNKIYEIYKIDIPKSTLRKLLFILSEQKKIKFTNNRKITLCNDELNKDFWDKRESRENLIEEFFIAFNDFLIDNTIEVSLNEIKKGTCKWLFTHSLELAYFINNGIFENDISDNWEYSSQLVLFLMEIQSKSSQHFKTFLLLYNGAIQSTLLNFETEKIENVCDSSIPFENIILDTNFILRMLNLQSEFDCDVAQETLSALKSQNAKFFILNQTIIEVQNSIKNYLKESEPYTSYTQIYFKGQHIRMSGFWEASKRGVSRTSMLEKTKRETLKSSILELIDVTYIDDFDDTKLSNEQINSLVSSKNRDTYGDRQAIHDLCLIEYCKKNRKNHFNSVSDINWWVLTNDERLTFWNQQNSDEYQECLTEIQLSNLMWIQRNRNDNLGLTQTIVSLSTTASITYSDIEQFAKNVHIYQKKNKNNVENLDKISILFASNMLTTSDIQKISAEEDALDQIVEEKVLEIQEIQTLQQQNGEKLLNENELLLQKNNILSFQLKKEQCERKIDKLKRDLLDMRIEQKTNCEDISILTDLDEQKNKYAISSGRLVIILTLMPTIFVFILYFKFGYQLVSSLLKEIVVMPDFLQDTILLIIPILCSLLYYIIVGIIYGSLLPPKNLFEKTKSKLINIRLKKYARKSNINLKYLSKDFKFEILKVESDLKITKSNIELIQNRITELNDEISLLDVN